MNLRFVNGRACLPGARLERAEIRVENGRITAVAPSLPVQAGERVVDAADGFIAPGFIDLHVHGALGRDAMEASPAAFETICRYHASGGTTAVALTTVCAPWRDIGLALDAARAWRPESGKTGARLAGVHVEGPYFSPEKRGAHRPEFLRVPEPDDFDHWIRYADVITQITLAPELPGMRALIPQLVAAGFRVSGGHSDAWDEDAQFAFAAGMRQVTHTFNCMSVARRRGPFRVAGLTEAALARRDVVCEVIADGHHVSPTLLRMLWNAKGRDGVALITDATAGAGRPAGSSFSLGEISCVVGNGVATTADGAALAGSTCRMIDGVATLVRDAGVPLAEAVHAATATPAACLGLDQECGAIRPGHRADLTLFTEDFVVRSTFVDGREVFGAA